MTRSITDQSAELSDDLAPSDTDTIERVATAAEKAAQQARSKKYHIAVKDGGSITKPSQWADVPDDGFADPVNYSYPMPDKAHADNAAARWGDASNREAYSSAEQKIISDRIDKRQAHFGEGKDTAENGKGARAAGGDETLTGAFYAPFTRRDDDRWEVEGIMTSEAVDTYGTMFDYDSAKRAADAWAGNIREQHDLHKAVGKRVDIHFDDDNRQVILRARISKGAPDTWAKICDGTLTGFSISAYDAKRETRTLNDRAVPCYTGYRYGEVSVVDVPSNPDAAASGLVLYRAAALTEDGTDYLSDVLDTDAEVDHALEAVVTSATDEPQAEQRVEAVALVAPPTLAELLAQFAIPNDQREAIARAVAQLAPAMVAQEQPLVPLVPTSQGDTETVAVVAPAVAAASTTEVQRVSMDTASGAGFQGSDLATPDNGTNVEQPIGRAMLRDRGQAHAAHDHTHATSYGAMHTHTHEHAHLDGTAHDHPHMHAHGHHDHFGDENHTHPHTHTHDHSHEYRAAAADLSTVIEPYPVTATPVETPVNEERAAEHDPYTGTHTHGHSAFGSQGDDMSHEHEHEHAGDANHDHDHPEPSARVADVPVETLNAEPVIERAGARISSATQTGLHEAALVILSTCACPVCVDASSLYDPDNDGDDDGNAAGDTDSDGGMSDARAVRRQQVTLNRAARTAVDTAIQGQLTPLLAQFRAIAARLIAVQEDRVPLTRMTSQLDEVRAALVAVAGQVDQIAQQDARVGPILRAADKTLGMASSMVLDPSAPPNGDALSPDVMRMAIRRLQDQGMMRSQTEQVNAAAYLIEQQMKQSGR